MTLEAPERFSDARSAVSGAWDSASRFARWWSQFAAAIRLPSAFTVTDRSLHLKAVNMQQQFKLNCTGNELIVVPRQ